MVERSRQLAIQLAFRNVEFHEGFVESAPVDDGWADVVGIIPGGVVEGSDVMGGEKCPPPRKT